MILGGPIAAWAQARNLAICAACAQPSIEDLEATLCRVCGRPVAIGEWPCVYTVREHGRSVQTNAFAAYFDYGLGREITGLGDREQAMRAEGTDVVRTADGREALTEGRGRLVYRDLPSNGDLSARRDRIEQQKKERQR